MSKKISKSKKPVVKETDKCWLSVEEATKERQKKIDELAWEFDY